MIFIDNANKVHALNEIGKIKISNLCTEIFQLQTTSKINDYEQKDEIGYDISCNLGSLNIVNLMDNNNFEKVIYTATKSLSIVSDISNVKNAPGVKKANDAFNAIGLGVMNLHGFFAKNNIMYESTEALDFCNVLFPLINYYSLLASNKLAIEKEKSFEKFEKSTYYTGEYFNQYKNTSFVPKTNKVKNIFKDIYIPSLQDWEKLCLDIKENGLYNGYRLAIAPTQSISYIQNSTASVQPIVSQIETRMYKDSQTYYPMPFLSKQNVLFYKSAYNMDQKKIIDLVSVIQPHVDQGISTVLFVTNNTTTSELAHYYYYAFKKGLKSLYYVRTKNMTLEECESCSV
jgi:ribonucleoside-diphosphate reductase alpha chain